MLTVHLSARLQRNLLSRMIPYLINILTKMTMVDFFLANSHPLSPNRFIDCCSLELEPRRQRDDGFDMFVDLGATLEDHGEVSASPSKQPLSASQG
jgi:hypothetical protein